MSLSTDYIPGREADLLNWSTNFKTKITAAPTTYGLTAAMATAYTTLHNNFVSAYNAITDPATRSPVNITLKDVAKTTLIANARMLARTVQGTSTVSVAQKEELGLNPRDIQPSPVPPPALAPDIDILLVSGNTVRIRMHDSTSASRRGKPDGVDGAGVFSFVGANPPAAESDWKFEGITSRTRMDIAMPPGTAPGSRVWFTAYWFNQRKQRGPVAQPVSTNIAGGGAIAA